VKTPLLLPLVVHPHLLHPFCSCGEGLFEAALFCCGQVRHISAAQADTASNGLTFSETAGHIVKVKPRLPSSSLLGALLAMWTSAALTDGTSEAATTI